MGQSRHRFCSKARRTCGGKGCTPPRTPLRTHVNRGRSSFLMRVNRGRTSGAGRVALRSFAGWAFVAPARQGGELAPFGRSDSAALPPRLRSSHPAEFALGHAPRARGSPPSRGRPDLSGATHDPPDNSGLLVPEDRPRCTRMCRENRPQGTRMCGKGYATVRATCLRDGGVTASAPN